MNLFDNFMKTKTPRTDAAFSINQDHPHDDAGDPWRLASNLERELAEARNNLKLQINENMRVGEDIWRAREALRKALPHLESGIFRDPEGADKVAINIRIILSNVPHDRSLDAQKS
jgi:hypothetical protein